MAVTDVHWIVTHGYVDRATFNAMQIVHTCKHFIVHDMAVMKQTRAQCIRQPKLLMKSVWHVCVTFASSSSSFDSGACRGLARELGLSTWAPYKSRTSSPSPTCTAAASAQSDIQAYTTLVWRPFASSVLDDAHKILKVRVLSWLA